MSATASISWTNQASGTLQELYYGKDTLVTGVPGSGSGWIPSDQNPLPATAGSLVVSNLDDNVKYKFVVKSDCTNSQNIYSTSTGIKWICGALQTSGPQLGILSYVLQIDPSVSNPGSAITNVVVELIGVDRVNYGTLYQSKSYGAPYSSSYTDQFNNVNGDVDWTIRVVYKTGTYPSIEIHECYSQTYSTIGAPGLSYLQIRNGLQQGTLSQLRLNASSQLPQALDAGIASKSDITALLTGGGTFQPSVTIPDIVVGSQLFAKQIRANAQLTGGLFTYSGSNSNISAVPWSLQNGDIIEITDAFIQGIIFKQPIVTKVTDGYDLSMKIDVPLGSITTYTVKFTGYDYSSGTSEHLTTTLTIPQGQTISATVHLVSTLTTLQYSAATISSLCIIPASGVTIPYYYTCPA